MNNVQHVVLLFFFNEPDTTEIYTLSLHDALPISYATHQEEIDSLIRNLNENVPELMSKVTTITSKDRKSTRLNSSHVAISYAVFCLKKKKYDMLIILKYNISG